VKRKDTKVITRVSNETAKELVATGEYYYSSKSGFKRIMRSDIGKSISLVNKTKRKEINSLINTVNKAANAEETSVNENN
jgi:hypothetical protein